MQRFDTPEHAIARHDLEPRLCATIEGVEFWITLPDGQSLRCVISAPALEAHYDAEKNPSSWLDSFGRHRAEIERRALAASARRADVHVVLVTDSSGQLRCVAGRCGP